MISHHGIDMFATELRVIFFSLIGLEVNAQKTKYVFRFS